MAQQENGALKEVLALLHGTHQHPFRLRLFGSGAPSFFGRGMLQPEVHAQSQGAVWTSWDKRAGSRENDWLGRYDTQICSAGTRYGASVYANLLAVEL